MNPEADRWRGVCDDPGDSMEEEEATLRERIARHDFDLVVFGSVHRGLPFWAEVQASYARRDIAFLDGEDDHLGGWGAPSARLFDKGHYFMREIPDGCPPVSVFSRE